MGMKVSGLLASLCVVGGIASPPQAASQQATADQPVMCWTYNTLGENIGSRFGIKGAVDDAILSRAAYYTITKLKPTVAPPIAAGSSTWFKVEVRAEADGADAPLKLSGLLVELDNPIYSAATQGVTSERHTDGAGKLYRMSVVPLEARFKAGDTIVTVPFSSRGPDLRRQDVEVMLGAYAPRTWLSGQSNTFDPAATLPLVQKIDAAWKSAGVMTIEFALAGDGSVVATSEALAYLGDAATAEFARMDGRAHEMISDGKCQFLTD